MQGHSLRHPFLYLSIYPVVEVSLIATASARPIQREQKQKKLLRQTPVEAYALVTHTVPLRGRSLT